MMGSAYKNKAVQLLLDGVLDYLPNPAERHNYALDADEGEKEVGTEHKRMKEGRELVIWRVGEGEGESEGESEWERGVNLMLDDGERRSCWMRRKIEIERERKREKREERRE